MNVLAFVLQLILALMFATAGLGKLSGARMHVENFGHWRLPQWFRNFTGLVECVGAALLVFGFWRDSWAAAGALLLGLTAIGGILTHLRAKDSFSQTFLILLLAAIAIVLFLMRASSLADFPGS